MSTPLPQKVSTVGWRRLLSVRLLEDLCFVLATAYAFWFALAVLNSGRGVVGTLAAVIVFWAVVAYLAMPRLNQMLTGIYVPDYFMGRTRAGDGVLGDAVNLAVQGTEGQVRAAMTRAGWTLADPVTLRSSWGIVVSAVLKRSYPAAPVSPLFLFGRMQDLAYQQEVDGNASQRHHVRFFRVPAGWVLPGGHAVDWLASASYDRAVGLSLFTGQVTHKIDADIDVERDHVVATLRRAVPGVTVDVLEHFSTSFTSRNGGGDVIRTDGALPIVDLRSLTPAPFARVAPRTFDVGARPTSVVLAAVLVVVSAVVTTASALADPAYPHETLALGLLAGLDVALLALAYGTYRGWAWARALMLVLASASLLSHGLLTDDGVDTLASVGLDLGLMYALTSSGAREWTGEPDEAIAGRAAG